jgi:hypothetical protein
MARLERNRPTAEAVTHLAIAAAILLALIYGACGANFVRFSRLMLAALALFAVFVWWANTRGP